MKHELFMTLTRVVHEGTKEERAIVRQCFEINDMWGLEWALKNMRQGL